MKISELFAEDISRRIEGVVKVSDESDLLNETREFVVTDEINRLLVGFFDKYNGTGSVNPGVWLSGFFGTGKSHLLKILSHVLSNRRVDGIALGELFKEKVKDDFELEAKVMQALRIPTRTILFNIDSVADQAYRAGEANIFMPFKKMFDRAMGFAEDPSVAKLERDLVYARRFDLFKEKFREISGKEWEDSRGKLLVMGKQLDAAFAAALGEDPAAHADTRGKYKRETPLSVESFINDIRDYLESQPEGARLVFLVDEIGQYISRDPRTMLNLQTLVEDFAVAFKGRVWIIVTAQEEVTEMVKTMGQVEKSDFSKILARFEVKVKLSSQNAREVLQKRLLKKKPESDRLLRDFYDKQGEVLRTRFTFNDGAPVKSTIAGEEAFASFYPILPYQVDLFQLCLISLSNHGAFEGNYASVGARSMLGVFQSALISMKDRDLGDFVPFDLFFEGTRALLKTQPFHTISLLEGNNEDPQKVRLLKLLYLLKYENGFKTTVKNLAVLMTSEGDRGREELETTIHTALDQLVRYNYVQEVGGAYEFQTDIQQEVVRRINATELQKGEIRNYFASQLFDEMLGRNNVMRLKHDRLGLDFDYSKRIDGHDYKARIGDISIHFICGAEDNYPNETELLALSMAQHELLIVLPQDRKLYEDVALFLRTNRYASISTSEKMSDDKLAVITAKRKENDTRRLAIVERFKSLATGARFLFNGREIASQSADFHVRLREAAQHLIDGSYIYLNKVLRVPTRNDIVNLLRDYTSDDLIAEFSGFNEVESELLNYISRQVDSGVRVDLRSLIEYFKKIPYGYVNDDIIKYSLVNLFINSKVTIFLSVNELKPTELMRYLDNGREHGSVLVKTVEDISPEMVQTVRRFYFDWFGKQLTANDTKLVQQEMKEDLGKEAQELKNLAFSKNIYPFLHKVEAPLERLEKAISFENKKFFDYIEHIAPFMMEDKEELDRIRHFMNGPNRKLYDSAKELLRVNAADLDLIESPSKEVLRNFVEAPEPYRNPQYNSINNAVIDLNGMISNLTQALREDLLTVITRARETFPTTEGYGNIPAERLPELERVITELENRVTGAPGLAALHILRQWLPMELTTRLLQKVHDLQPAPPVTVVSPNIGTTDPKPVPPPVKFIQVRNIHSDYRKSQITTPAEVEEYLASIKEKMLEEIKNGNRLIPG